MRKLILSFVAMMLAAQLATTAAATSVYRCVGANGVLKFQDMPCQNGEDSRRIHLPDASPGPVVDSLPPAAESSARSSRSKEQRESAPVVRPSVTAFLCTREDGGQYLSDNGHGNRRQVPLGMTGYPGRSLADAYAGPNGIGVSAPGLRTPPSSHAYSGQLGGAYVWIEDPCGQINAAQLCGFLDSRVTETERRLRLAFSDTTQKVQRELDALRQRRASQCSR